MSNTITIAGREIGAGHSQPRFDLTLCRGAYSQRRFAPHLCRPRVSRDWNARVLCPDGTN